METQKAHGKLILRKSSCAPDEEKVRESRHVVRAFADVAPSDNLDINIGPELILKDDNSRDQIAKFKPAGYSAWPRNEFQASIFDWPCGRFLLMPKTGKLTACGRCCPKNAPMPKTGEVYPTENAIILTGGNNVQSMAWGFPRRDGKGVIFKRQVGKRLAKTDVCQGPAYPSRRHTSFRFL